MKQIIYRAPTVLRICLSPLQYGEDKAIYDNPKFIDFHDNNFIFGDDSILEAFNQRYFLLKVSFC